ncbi:hypothetical protein BN1723_018435, partial [Verticillium longisporum]
KYSEIDNPSAAATRIAKPGAHKAKGAIRQYRLSANRAVQRFSAAAALKPSINRSQADTRRT